MNLIALLLSLSLINALPTDSNIEKRGLNLNIFSKLKPSFKRPAPIHEAESLASLSQKQFSSGQAGSRVPPSSHANDFNREPFSPSPPNDRDTIFSNPSRPQDLPGSKEIDGSSPPTTPGAPVPVRPKRKKPLPNHKFPKPAPFKPKLDTVYDGISAEVSAIINPWKKAQKEYSDVLKALDKMKAEFEASNMDPEIKDIYMDSFDKLVQRKKATVDSLHPSAQVENFMKKGEDLKLQADNIEKEADLKMKQLLSDTTDQKTISDAVEAHRKQMLTAENIKSEAESLFSKALIAKEAESFIS